MSEAALWRRVRKGLPGHLVRVENAVEAGTPDVNYCIDGAEGWIELKQLDRWPARGKSRHPTFTGSPSS